MKKIIIGIVIALVIVAVAIFGYLSFSSNSVVRGTTNLDSLSLSGDLAVAGTVSSTGAQSIDGGILYSYTYSTTTGTTVTLKQSDLLNYTTILATPIVGATTWTLPASSTLTSFVPTAGDIQRLTIVNASTTSGITLTLAAGTGSTIKSATTTLQIRPNTQAVLQCARLATTDINCLFLNGY